MRRLFDDRHEAGRLLGEVLAELDADSPVVLALPRGGVPVGSEVARVLGCDLDVLVVRKIGVPGQPELAMGAVAEGGVVIRNEDVVSLAGVDETIFEEIRREEQSELDRRLETYRRSAAAVDPAGHTAIVVDDGLATGATASAAVAVLRQRGVSEVWVAVPVAPREAVQAMQRLADRVVVLHAPSYFGAVGSWYRDFSQTTDREVERLLAESRLR